MHDDDFTKGMRGQFRGDFSRDTFDPLRHFSRVLLQQGRVQLDADWNEQVSIFAHYLRMLGFDLMGPHGVPSTDDGTDWPGFALSADGTDLTIMPGRYYVGGILCENSEITSFFKQPDWPLEQEAFEAGDYLIYLDVWERHISYVEDDYIREKALAGPDTASRAKVVWQMKAILLDAETDANVDFKGNYASFLARIDADVRPGTGLLRARAKRAAPAPEPCLISPEASYRGPENQLYRIEIHNPGNSDAAVLPTFKWSRENASVIFPIRSVEGEKIVLEHFGRDDRFKLQPNDWVELADDHSILSNQVTPLHKIEAVDRENLTITLQAPPGFVADASLHPYVRRWDQKKGDSNGIPVVEGNSSQDWILLEEGIEIQFPAPIADPVGNTPSVHRYQAGDYWLIPARSATGDVEWPGPVDAPVALPPQGVKHYYAPIWRVSAARTGRVTATAANDMRRKLTKAWN